MIKLRNKITNKLKTNKKAIIQTFIMASIIVIPNLAFANANTAPLDNIITTIVVPWVQRLGMVIAFIGAIMFALGWRNDDADSKARGISTLVSGFMASGVAGLYSQFIQ